MSDISVIIWIEFCFLLYLTERYESCTLCSCERSCGNREAFFRKETTHVIPKELCKFFQSFISFSFLYVSLIFKDIVSGDGLQLETTAFLKVKKRKSS